MFEKGLSGNPNGRPVGASNKRTLVRDALDHVYDHGETGFWIAVAEKAKEGDSNAVTLLAARLVPPLRATDSPIMLAGLDTGTLVEKANNIVGHMGAGDISPSEATSMLNAITALCRVTEIEVLASRLANLERILKERK